MRLDYVTGRQGKGGRGAVYISRVGRHSRSRHRRSERSCVLDHQRGLADQRLLQRILRLRARGALPQDSMSRKQRLQGSDVSHGCGAHRALQSEALGFALVVVPHLCGTVYSTISGTSDPGRPVSGTRHSYSAEASSDIQNAGEHDKHQTTAS